MLDVGYLNISLITKSNKLLHYFYYTEQIGLLSLLKLTFRILGLIINSHWPKLRMPTYTLMLTYITPHSVCCLEES